MVNLHDLPTELRQCILSYCISSPLSPPKNPQDLNEGEWIYPSARQSCRQYHCRNSGLCFNTEPEVIFHKRTPRYFALLLVCKTWSADVEYLTKRNKTKAEVHPVLDIMLKHDAYASWLHVPSKWSEVKCLDIQIRCFEENCKSGKLPHQEEHFMGPILSLIRKVLSQGPYPFRPYDHEKHSKGGKIHLECIRVIFVDAAYSWQQLKTPLIGSGTLKDQLSRAVQAGNLQENSRGHLTDAVHALCELIDRGTSFDEDLERYLDCVEIWINGARTACTLVSGTFWNYSICDGASVEVDGREYGFRKWVEALESIVGG